MVMQLTGTAPYDLCLQCTHDSLSRQAEAGGELRFGGDVASKIRLASADRVLEEIHDTGVS